MAAAAYIPLSAVVVVAAVVAAAAAAAIALKFHPKHGQCRFR